MVVRFILPMTNNSNIYKNRHYLIIADIRILENFEKYLTKVRNLNAISHHTCLSLYYSYADTISSGSTAA